MGVVGLSEALQEINSSPRRKKYAHEVSMVALAMSTQTSLSKLPTTDSIHFLSGAPRQAARVGAVAPRRIPGTGAAWQACQADRGPEHLRIFRMN
ncbi:hypothetical protein AJ87_21075 [Rhizobium yanglingense]|nr:hypothetical protein AJ87_21075 [Rhizobium yanglingense]